MSPMRIRFSDLLPFLLLFPPVISLYSEFSGAELCWIPGLIHTKYLEWFRIPVFDSFLFAWVPLRIPGFVSDLITIYLLFGSLNAKTVNYTERIAAPGGLVGIRRILAQIRKGDFRLAGTHLMNEVKLVVLWPRTIMLFWTYYRRSPPPKPARPANYFGDLVERMTWIAAVALLVIPLISGVIFYVGVHLCGPAGSV